MSEDNKAKHTIKNSETISGILIGAIITTFILIFMKTPIPLIIIIMLNSSVVVVIAERLREKYGLTNYVWICVLISTCIFIYIIEFGLLFIFLLLSALLT